MNEHPILKVLAIGYFITLCVYLAVAVFGVGNFYFGNDSSKFALRFIALVYATPLFVLTNLIALYMCLRKKYSILKKIGLVAFFGYLTSVMMFLMFFALSALDPHSKPEDIYSIFLVLIPVPIFLGTTVLVLIMLLGYVIYHLVRKIRSRLKN